ncbi:MAG: T9SS type A sorting domain-containing protein [Bacteroidales bacterium]|nr:T9SS type A sorting domain-containing protein [Bacteroidales bacterium]
MKPKLLFSAIFLCLAGMAYGQWTYTELSSPKKYMGVTSYGDKVYFAGGSNGTSTVTTVESYDVETGEWANTGNLSLSRLMPAATYCGTKLFFAGGATGNFSPVGTVDIYDIATGQWSAAQLQVGRFDIAAVSHGDKVFFAGGCNFNIVCTDIVDIYDMTTNTWSFTYLSMARAGMAYAVVGDLAIFAGGFLNGGDVSNRVDIYNFSTNTWSTASLSQARVWATAVTVGDNVLIAGGIKNFPDVPTDVVDIFNSTTGTWSTASLFEPRAWITGGAINGKAYFAGGSNVANGGVNYDFSDIVDVLDKDGNVEGYEFLAHPRASQGLAVGNHLVVAGGTGESGVLSSVEIFSEESSSCLPEGITLTTQEQIDNFQINYPGCSDILGDIVIEGNSITNLNGLNVLHSVAGNLTIMYNPNLSNLNGLNNLEVIGGYLYIIENTSLTSLTGLEGLVSVGDWLQILHNDLLPNLLGLNNLQTIGGKLAIVHNDGIINLEGLGNLSSIGGDFAIAFSPALLSLTGLNSLTTIGGILGFQQNPLITSLAGLENISANSVTDLKIYINASLSTCDVQSICEYLASPGGTIEIHDNAPGCNSPEEVIDACLIQVEEVSGETGLLIIPNPASDWITISTEEGIVIRQVTLTNRLGQEVCTGLPETNRLDVSGLSPGMYVLSVLTNRGEVKQKVIIE